MKEATGELSTTVITITAIALVIAIFTSFLLPTLRSQIALTQACSGGPGYTITNDNGSSVSCGKASTTVVGGAGRSWTCTYTPADGGRTQTKTCTE